MILLHVITSERNDAIEIADFLSKEKLILNPIIQDTTMREKKTDNGDFKSVPQTLLMGKSKALLFTTIDRKIRERYSNRMPVIYALPIVYMDWEQADELIKETEKV